MADCRLAYISLKWFLVMVLMRLMWWSTKAVVVMEDETVLQLWWICSKTILRDLGSRSSFSFLVSSGGRQRAQMRPRGDTSSLVTIMLAISSGWR